MSAASSMMPGRKGSDLLNLLVAELRTDDVLALARNRMVDAVSLDVPVHGSGGQILSSPASSTTTPPTLAPIATTSVRQTLGLSATASYETLTGSHGIGVAVIDSGITPSADFGNRIVRFYDFTRGGVASAPYDDNGHGTHVAGLIASSGILSNYAFQGIAPGVLLTGLKVLDAQGGGHTSDVIAALQFVTANPAALGVQIVNLSLGHPIYSDAAHDPLVQAVQQASAAGLIVITAAGNHGRNDITGDPGYAGVTSPCNAPSTICVGAVNTNNTTTRADDAVAPYSSRGPSWYA